MLQPDHAVFDTRAQLQHGLIDYFAANEAILLALCVNAGFSPEIFIRVWHRLNRVD